MLTAREAERELDRGVKLNPGPWREHSLSVAGNARLIAGKAEGMDAGTAYIMGLMHDIGRRAGIKGILHIFDGYDHMMRLDQPELARICLTHSFPMKDVHTFAGRYDCSDDQLTFLEGYLDQIEYDDYDKLIQLCDAVSLPGGACIMEKRLVDVALRNGLPDFTIDKWRAFIEVKKYFDGLCGCNIYSLLPNVMENSYESLI